MTPRLTSLLVAVALLSEPAFPQHPETDSASLEAQALHAKLQALRKRRKPGTTGRAPLPVSASELNAYLQSRYVVLPEGVSDVEVGFEDTVTLPRVVSSSPPGAQRVTRGVHRDGRCCSP